MKVFLIIICLCTFLQVPAQEPFTKNRWNTNAIIGLKDFRFSDKATELVLDTLNQKYPYGYITEFLADRQFISYNIGPCGNECRIMVKGRYTMSGNTIELFVKSLSYAKECKDTPSEEVNTLLGIYTWKQENTKLTLKPIEH